MARGMAGGSGGNAGLGDVDTRKNCGREASHGRESRISVSPPSPSGIDARYLSWAGEEERDVGWGLRIEGPAFVRRPIVSVWNFVRDSHVGDSQEK